jgi:hypothetical protein
MGQRVYKVLINELAIEEPWQLVNSTDFASRVVWPAALKGENMFLFSPSPAKTALGRWLLSLGLQPNTNVQTLAPAVVARTGV